MTLAVAVDRHVYQIIPALRDVEYAHLKADIAENGVEVPAVLDEDGNVLDGHHRIRICTELGIECPTTVRRGLSEPEKRLLAARLNINRRHLTDGQRAMLGRMLEPDLAEQARARMLAGKPVDPSDNCHAGRTTDEIAEFVKLGSGRTYERYRSMLDEIEVKSPEVLARVASGEIGMREASRIVNPKPPREPVSRTVDDDDDDDPSEALDAQGWSDEYLPVDGISEAAEHLVGIKGVTVIYYRVPNPELRVRTINGRERTYRRESKVERRVIEWVHDGEPDAADAALRIGKAAGIAVRNALEAEPLR